MNTHPNPPEPPRPPAVPPPLKERNTAPHRDEHQDRDEQAHIEDLLDKALADTFPASDPVSGLTADAPVTHSARE